MHLFCKNILILILFNRTQESGDSSKILTPVKKEIKEEKKEVKSEPSSQVPPGVEDFDKENMSDPIQVANYAMEIFDYMKLREKSFQVDDYMSRQVGIKK